MLLLLFRIYFLFCIHNVSMVDEHMNITLIDFNRLCARCTMHVCLVCAAAVNQNSTIFPRNEKYIRIEIDSERENDAVNLMDFDTKID